MELPTPMTSLTTHRISSLESKYKETQEELDTLIQTGKRNDEKFHWLRTVVLALFDVENWTELNIFMKEILSGRDNIDAVRLFLWNLPTDPEMDCIRPAQELGSLEQRTRSLASSICEKTRPDDFERFFGKQPEEVTSIALVPVSFVSIRGLLVVGSDDPMHFEHAMSTLFLDFLGDMMGRTLNKIVRS